MSPAAVAQYEAATKYAPWFLPAYVNLAELQRQGGNEVVAEQTLRRALAEAPRDAGVLYALGLSVYRQQRPAEAVALLAEAAARRARSARAIRLPTRWRSNPRASSSRH